MIKRMMMLAMVLVTGCGASHMASGARSTTLASVEVDTGSDDYMSEVRAACSRSVVPYRVVRTAHGEVRCFAHSY